MEGLVIDHNQSVVIGIYCSFSNIKIQFKREGELWVAVEVGFHLDAYIDSDVEYMPIVAEEYIEAFEDVNKYFVFLVGCPKPKQITLRPPDVSKTICN